MRPNISSRISRGLNRLALVAAAGLVCAAAGALVQRSIEAATTNVNVGQQNGGSLASTQFNVATISITTGDTVHWQWFNGNHTVFSYDESSPGVPQWKTPGVMTMSGDSFDHLFTTAGTYTYYCSIHGFRDGASPASIDANIAAGAMMGKIVVTAPPPVGGESSAPDTLAALAPTPWHRSLPLAAIAIVLTTFSIGAVLVTRRKARQTR